MTEKSFSVGETWQSPNKIAWNVISISADGWVTIQDRSTNREQQVRQSEAKRWRKMPKY